MSFGTWENRTWVDIQAREPQVLSEWKANFDTVAPPAGESFEQLQARALTGIEGKIVGARCAAGVTPVPQLGLNTSETPVLHYLVATHAGVIRAAVSAFSGLPLRKVFEVAVPYGSYTSFCWMESTGAQSILSQENPLILLKKHIFRMLCWMLVGISIIMPGIDESTEV